MEHATPSPLCSTLVALLLATGLATRPQRGYAADAGAPAASSVGIEFLDETAQMKSQVVHRRERPGSSTPPAQTVGATSCGHWIAELRITKDIP